VSQLDLLGLSNPSPADVLNRWSPGPRAGTMPAVSGVVEEGTLDLDLAIWGPHALIAGTTGSGKSGLLQTFVASIALANPPDRVSFLLVDFKGKSTFGDCERLPHTVGVISNLDGVLVERALDSLQAELRWRQRQLAGVGAQSFEQYRVLADDLHPIMTRLVVVVDELFELVDAYKDAVARLSQVARLGRSLGVHLVLATQKPSSVPGLADLRANTDLRICFRVQDPMESTDMVGVSDAASIPRDLIGRGIVRAGSEQIQFFQAGYLGGAAAGLVEEEDLTLTGWELDRRSPVGREPARLGDDDTLTELAVLVNTIRAAAERAPFGAVHPPWLPSLPGILPLDDPRVATEQPGPAVSIGLMDRPDQQTQDPFVLDLDQLGHLIVVGPSRSGRTSTLRTIAGAIASRLSVRDAHIYALDFRRRSLGDLELLPHCGGVIGLDDPDRFERAISFLEEEISRRAAAMGGASSLAEQRRSGQGMPLAHIVVLCDSYEAFYERFAHEDGGRMVDRFNALLSDGPARGVHFVVTTERRTLLGRLGSLVEARLHLRPIDRDDRVALGLPADPGGRELPPGRGYWWEGPTETQVCLLAADPRGEAQTEAITSISRRPLGYGETRFSPPAIPPLPSRVDLDQLLGANRTSPESSQILIGVGGIRGTAIGFDAADLAAGVVIVGPRGSGRTNALATMVRGIQASSRNPHFAVVALRRSVLRQLEGTRGVTVLTSAETLAADLTELSASAGPVTLIVDDAEMILDSPASGRFDKIVRSAPDLGWGIVVAGSVSELGRRFSGWPFELRQNRTGLVLQPSAVADTETLDIRIPRALLLGSSQPVGRAILVRKGRWCTAQVAVSGI
jgi:S-DNA-T family DNA segregation ATPase FtsK/SpoIIIE